MFDTPLAEGGIVTIAMGMGSTDCDRGGDPFADYIFPAYDRSSTRSPNSVTEVEVSSDACDLPNPAGGGIKGGHHHSQSPEAQFTHTPGLKVVYCSTPYNAKGCSPPPSSVIPGCVLRTQAVLSGTLLW